MRIDTAATLTVSALRSLLEGADGDARVEFFRTPKRHQTGSCWCGCGESTKSKFAPGHDSKFHSLAKQVARGTEEMPENFVNEDAKADFMKWHDAEVPKHAAKMEAKRVRILEREAAKAASKEADETEEEAVEDELDALFAEV